MAYALDVDQSCPHQVALAFTLGIGNENRGGGMCDTMNVLHFSRPFSSKDHLGENVRRCCLGRLPCRLDKRVLIVLCAVLDIRDGSSLLVMFYFF